MPPRGGKDRPAATTLPGTWATAIAINDNGLIAGTLTNPYGAQGRRVATLARGSLGAGSHDARWDGREAGGAGAPAGLYVARLTTCEGSLTRRLLLVR